MHGIMRYLLRPVERETEEVVIINQLINYSGMDNPLFYSIHFTANFNINILHSNNTRDNGEITRNI